MVAQPTATAKFDFFFNTSSQLYFYFMKLNMIMQTNELN